MSSPQISPYSLPDLKSTTDDALPNYLTSLKFAQDHYLTDVRLALGYTAVIIAGALFYVDWKMGWEVTKPYTLPAVVAYFALNTAFTYWMWWVERGAVFVGKRQGVKITIESSTPKKYSPEYHLTIRTQGPKGPEKETKISAPFTRWFTSDGFFVAKPFQQWLASSVEAIGEADPQNVVEEIGRGSEIESKSAAQATSVNLGNDLLGQILGSSGAQRTSKGATRRGCCD